MLNIRNLTIERLTGGGAEPLLSLKELTIKKSEIVTLMGPSGTGKSTFLRWLLGESLPNFRIQGQLGLNGEDISEHSIAKRQLGMLFQKGGLFPHLTIEENCYFAQKPRSALTRKQQKEKALEMLKALGLEDKWTAYPESLSGGQYARTALLCSLLAEPRAMLLDEPFSSLDASLREEVRQWTFAQLQRKEVPTLLVTHDRADAFGRVLEVKDSEVTGETENV
ncbi:ATP-binding cassette domain-containing protein [Idiomarina ramblicola]|uniref:ABC transporter ATP-binding protein n=1 Tax=Idiomarina ramblicola TaxID=263724 RepID=A0A432YVC9_9GAMM|nr:ATP-binding cassette domain-containing protein [Idiomarina ramblicola]RUO67284.1 ABC transporter ATP-binding protein [Idiomarina ramblicola]